MPLALAASLCLALATVPSAAAPAQEPPAASMNDLRLEIDRLNAEIAKRDEELRSAQARIKELEAAIATLRSLPAPAAAPAAAPATTAPPAPEPVPADPAIGPAGLVAAIQSAYLVDFPDRPDASTPQKLDAHLRALENWCARANRTGMKRVAWTGRINTATAARDGRNVSFVAVFQNGTREHRVNMSVERTLMDRVMSRDGTIRDGDVVFTGIARPTLAVNPLRGAPGAFDNPPTVAPYVEMILSFDVQSLVPAAAAP